MEIYDAWTFVGFAVFSVHVFVCLRSLFCLLFIIIIVIDDFLNFFTPSQSPGIFAPNFCFRTKNFHAKHKFVTKYLQRSGLLRGYHVSGPDPWRKLRRLLRQLQHRLHTKLSLGKSSLRFEVLSQFFVS